MRRTIPLLLMVTFSLTGLSYGSPAADALRLRQSAESGDLVPSALLTGLEETERQEVTGWSSMRRAPVVSDRIITDINNWRFRHSKGTDPAWVRIVFDAPVGRGAGKKRSPRKKKSPDQNRRIEIAIGSDREPLLWRQFSNKTELPINMKIRGFPKEGGPWLPPQISRVEGGGLLVAYRPTVLQELVAAGVLRLDKGWYYRTGSPSQEQGPDRHETSRGLVQIVYGDLDSKGHAHVAGVFGRSCVERYYREDIGGFEGRYGLPPEEVATSFLEHLLGQEFKTQVSPADSSEFLEEDFPEETEEERDAGRALREDVRNIFGDPMVSSGSRSRRRPLSLSRRFESPSPSRSSVLRSAVLASASGWLESESPGDRQRDVELFCKKNPPAAGYAQELLFFLEMIKPCGWKPGTRSAPQIIDITDRLQRTRSEDSLSRPSGSTESGLEEMGEAVRQLQESGQNWVSLEPEHFTQIVNMARTAGYSEARLLRLGNPDGWAYFGQMTFYLYGEWLAPISMGFPLFGEGGPTIVPMDEGNYSEMLPVASAPSRQLIIWREQPLTVYENHRQIPQLISESPELVTPLAVDGLYINGQIVPGARILLVNFFEQDGQQYLLFFV